ncbi:transporter substrate-binding domain-containing protein [Rhizobiaceae bacterium BDR2-2]|uniref:Transporter substrate-binding domain-containing protein n=1 Tax=Ectorhizobium quercum TaxID=2965071 RepID=A0AAE3SV87_9HYPH|nr:transporter substrate-binding domain-containing protein [Ectorhizobium quercum]MCX8997463.1 transporter substrate-binding domain-containing protein [Ectorhizobium quercum]
MKLTALLMAAGLVTCGLAGPSHAQSALDTIVQGKKLRCGIMLDSPPSGFRNTSNEPDGFDVAYCRDMAAALGAEAEIVETPSPDRIPALVSNRIDVLIASTTPTPQRAMTVAFTQPYMNYTTSIITRNDTGIEGWEDLKSAKLGGVIGTTTEQLLNAEIEKGWKSSGATYTGFSSDTEAFLALQQGKVDAILQATAVFATLEASGQFPEFVAAGMAPINDQVSIAVKRDDQQFLNWAKLFVWQQHTSGRFAEIYAQFFGDAELPSLNAAGVDF